MPPPKQTDTRDIPIALADAEEIPIILANVFVLQLGNDGAFVLTVGQAAAPILYGDEEQQKQQVARVKTVRGKVVARLALTPLKLKELRDALSVGVDALEAANKGRKDAELTKSKVIPALLELDFSSSDDAEDDGFPFNVPDELSESQAKDLSRVLAQGVPDKEWVDAIRRHLNS